MILALVLAAAADTIPGYTYHEPTDTAVLDVSQFAPECTGGTVNVEVERGGGLTVVCHAARKPLLADPVAGKTTLIFPRPLLPTQPEVVRHFAIVKADAAGKVAEALRSQQNWLAACVTAYTNVQFPVRGSFTVLGGGNPVELFLDGVPIDSDAYDCFGQRLTLLSFPTENNPISVNFVIE